MEHKNRQVQDLKQDLNRALTHFQELSSTGDLDHWRKETVLMLHTYLEEAPEKTTEICRKHPLFHVLQQDPYHQRAWNKPRGYPGDAVMLDMIYDGSPNSVEIRNRDMTAIGGKVFGTWNRCDGCQAVRERARKLAREIELAATRSPRTRILSVACGHLREVEQVHHTYWPLIEEFIGFDQDVESLTRVDQSYPSLPIHVSHGRIKDLIHGRDMLGDSWDLIYSAGLFDYLEDWVAAKLLSVLVGRLRPGGRLLVANFRSTPELAWGHIFQDWRLICRDEQDFKRIIPHKDWENQIYVGPYGIMTWLEVSHKGIMVQ